MKLFRKKLKSSRGASMVLALVLFLSCAMVSAVILTAAGANAGRIASQRAAQSAYLSVSSAAQLLRSAIGAQSYAVTAYTLEGGACGLDYPPDDDISLPQGAFAGVLTALCNADAYPASCTVTLTGEALTVTGTLTMDAQRNITVVLDTQDDAVQRSPMTLYFAANHETYSTVSSHSHSYDTGGTEEDQPVYGICEYALRATVSQTSWDVGRISKGGQLP